MKAWVDGLEGPDSAEERAWWGVGIRADAAVEIFHACARFITVTGWDGIGDCETDISAVTEWLMERADKKTSGGQAGVAADDDGLSLRGHLEDVIAALGKIANEDAGWDDWSRIGMAVWGATGGSEEGYEAFREWSAKSGKHDDAACRERWDHWMRSPPDRLGIGTLLYEANKADPEWVKPSRKGKGESEASGTPDGGDAFGRLAARITYISVAHRFHDSATYELMDETRLNAEAASMHVPGAGARGAKGLVMRLMRTAGREGGIVKTHGLVPRPGGARHVMALNEHGLEVLMLNTWLPPARVKGDDGSIDPGPWLEHMRRLIPNKADRERVLDRLAWAVQNPGVKINSALVILGGQKTGKDTALEPFWAAVGEHNMSLVWGAQLGGDFNDYMLKPWLLISEMQSFRKKSIYEDIKGMLTTPPHHIRINLKGVPAFWLPNVVNVIITTNHADAVALAKDDRRFDVVVTVPADEGEGDVYFDKLYAWYARGGLGAAVWALRTRVIGERFHPKHEPPMSEAKAAMIREAEPPAVAWARGLWTTEEGLEGPLTGRAYVTLEEIMDMARTGAWGAGAVGGGHARGLPQHIVMALRLDEWLNTEVQVTDGGHRSRVWYRGDAPEIAKQFQPKVMRQKLEEDRVKSGRGMD